MTNPGITMVLNQTQGHAMVRINNVSMHVYPQDKFSTRYCGIHYNMDTASVYLERLHCHTEFNELSRHMLYGYRASSGLDIDPRDHSITDRTLTGSITITNSQFNNSRMQISPISRSNRQLNLTLTNIVIKHTIDPLIIVNIRNVTL